jgi:transposase
MVTAWALRAEIGRFDRFRTGKQLARYCGLSPRNASSGQRPADAGLIKAGSELLRATLIEAAHRLIRFDPRWAALGAKLRSAGKPGSVVAAAVANRWVRWLFHQVEGGAITLKTAG